MRVLQLCESFSPPSETFVYDTAVELEQQGVECYVLTMKRLSEVERPFSRVDCVSSPDRWNALRLAYRTLSYFGIYGDAETHSWPIVRSGFRRHIKKIRPDIIHAQFGPMGVLVAPIAESLDIPLVVTFHGYDISALPQSGQILSKYIELFRVADVLIGVSNYNCKRLGAIGAPRDKVALVYNGTRLDSFEFSDPASRFDGQEVRLLFVGRLVGVKSPLDLLCAFRLARERLGSVLGLTLTIAGDGPEANLIHKYIDDNCLREYVSLIGVVNHQKVQELMQTHHIYVQHCKKTVRGDEEGLGMTLIEAQASGLPVVSTRSGGIPEVVLDELTGYLVSEGDVENMADRIVELSLHPENWKNIGLAGRRHVSENFDIVIQTKKLVSIYNSCICDRSLDALCINEKDV